MPLVTTLFTGIIIAPIYIPTSITYIVCYCTTPCEVDWPGGQHAENIKKCKFSKGTLKVGN